MMIEVSAVQFLENPAYIQMLAKKEPVIVDNGDYKQVLVDYDVYKSLEKPAVSAYDVYMQIMSDFPKDKLDALADDSVEFDMSFSERT